MKALVLHPEDSPFDGPWSRTKWDLVLDLGVAGTSTYAEWSRRLGCAVSNLTTHRLADDAIGLRRLLDLGRGRLVDDLGIDWWDLNSVFFYQQLEQVMLLTRLPEQWRQADEIVVSRPCFQAGILRTLFGGHVRVNRRPAWSTAALNVKHYARVLSKFSFAQLGEILGDKYDPDYSVRRRFAKKVSTGKQSLVLVPSAYSNASRIVAAYARMVPDQRFLLVATRRSATLFDPPANMRVASLASYAKEPCSRSVVAALISKWSELLRNMEQARELQMYAGAGGFDQVPQLIATGVATRDAWRRVFEAHDIGAVFSGDEGNPYVCIPLRLANGRGIPRLSVHHGALDGRFQLKRPAAELCLAKSNMERDYLVNRCGLEAEDVVLAGLGPQPGRKATCSRDSARDVVYFTEPYEVLAGRTGEIYRELLPGLCRVARRAGTRIVIKLHPFESLRERKKLVERVLRPEDREMVQVADGPLTPGLLGGAWFGITVQSTVAVECALEGIPCFLCGWLADSSFGYARQFAKFGAGYILKSPEEITDIPQILASVQIPFEGRENLWSPMAGDTLRQLLTRTTDPRAVAAVG